MSDQEQLLGKLDRVAALAAGPKWRRLLHRPLGYPVTQLYRTVVYPLSHRPLRLSCATFFGQRMEVRLPSGMDLYLTGGKTHDSELRLARYIIRHLHEGETFVDVGAHYGYFSLLAATCVGGGGRVVALEASPATYGVLRSNAAASRVEAYHRAASDLAGELELLEFPNLYAEYNTLDKERYSQEDWYEKNPPRVQRVPAVNLTDFFSEELIRPNMIKIDVEGAEEKVVRGLMGHLQDRSPAIAMEYLATRLGNAPHEAAAARLSAVGYRMYVIGGTGELTAVSDMNGYLRERALDSDNVVFLKDTQAAMR